MTGITYPLLYLLVLIVPGWLLLRLSGLNAGLPVFTLAASYIYYILLAALSKWLNLPLNVFITIYLGLLALLAIAALRFRVARPPVESSRYLWWGLLIVIVAYSLYRMITGAYTEVPADFLHHLNFAREQLTAIEQGQLGPQRDLYALLTQRGGIWYSLYALLTSLSGLDLDQALAWTTLLNGLVFMSSVYGFAWYIFGHFALTANQRLAAALIASFFTAGHLGLNVFAYIRYYTLAPTMLNMVIYFAASIAVLELLRWRDAQGRYAGFLLLALLATTVVHNQEGLFILIMGGMMLGWFALYPRRLNPYPVEPMLGKYQRSYRILLLIYISSFLSLVVWAYLNLERPGDFSNKIIQLSEQGPIFNRILFLNPGFQAIEVITPWGLLVYALFIFYWRRFIGHPYLFPGMLIPLFTVFNPIFVDWFMRMDGVHTLWRILYIVPIHMAGALAFVLLVDSVRQVKHIFGRAVAGACIALLLLLLLPLAGLNNNSRLTLAAVDDNDSYLYWQDLMDYLDRAHPQELSILTDPVTGYMIKGLTHHRTYHFKFNDTGLHPVNLPDYSNAPFAEYSGWLLVVNDRNGGHSQAGEYARHWPDNILNTSTFYRAPLRQYIRNNPDKRFNKIWEKDDIRVYLIR